MGILDFIKSQAIDVIEWTDSTHDTLAWRFPAQGNEIKNGAQLTVREGQSAIFISEGQLADCFGPGRYALTTQKIPLLTKLASWKYGFNSPFKADIYFLNTRQYGELKWGTASPILIRDPEFQAVRVRARGGFVIQVADPPRFLRQVVGTDGRSTTDEIQSRMRGRLVAAFTEVLANSKVGVVDLAGSLEAIAATCRERIAAHFTEIGLRLAGFDIEAVTLPPEVEKALDRGSGDRIAGGPRAAAPSPPAAPACVKCRSSLTPGSKFCGECGAKVVS